MSIMSLPVVLRSRAAAAPAAPAVSVGEPIDGGTLADLGRGVTVQVVGVTDEAHPAIARRLFDLGFAPGAEVEMLRRAPLADPVVFRVAGYDIALRRAEARCIRVATPA